MKLLEEIEDATKEQAGEELGDLVCAIYEGTECIRQELQDEKLEAAIARFEEKLTVKDREYFGRLFKKVKTRHMQCLTEVDAIEAELGRIKEILRIP